MPKSPRLSQGLTAYQTKQLALGGDVDMTQKTGTKMGCPGK